MCPCSRWSQSSELERVAQRELNQPWCSYGAGDFTKRPGCKRLPGDLIVRNALHVVDRWIAELRVVPNIENVGREGQRLPLRQLEILDEGKVPVLLVRPAENVPAEIAKICGTEVRVVDRVALRRIEQRRGGEGVDVQIAVVDAALNAPRSQSTGECAAAGKAAGKRTGSKARAKEARPRRGIRHRERRAGLIDGDPAQNPAAQQSALHSRFIPVKRQVVAVAHDKSVWPVKVREAARSVQRGLIVEGGIERGVSSGCRVGGFREGVRSLEVACAPTARERCLQRMIVRISVVGEKLESCVAVDALSPRARHGIANGVRRDDARIGIAK